MAKSYLQYFQAVGLSALGGTVQSIGGLRRAATVESASSSSKNRGDQSPAVDNGSLDGVQPTYVLNTVCHSR